MGWETRRGKGQYYTRSRREGGRVVREYLGSGETASCIAALDNLDKARQENERAWATECQTEANELAALVGKFCATVETELRATLTAAGYHRHSRGRWRKRRQPNKEATEREK